MRKEGNRPVCSFVTILVQAAVIWRNSYHSYHHSCPNSSARASRPNVGVSEFPLHGSKPKKQTKGLKGSGYNMHSPPTTIFLQIPVSIEYPNETECVALRSKLSVAGP